MILTKMKLENYGLFSGVSEFELSPRVRYEKTRPIILFGGKNGAGKTTLISTICGICLASSGQVLVNGHDTLNAYRETRKLIGLVPQDVSLEPFETVLNTVRFSRGLHGKPKRHNNFMEMS